MRTDFTSINGENDWLPAQTAAARGARQKRLRYLWSLLLVGAVTLLGVPIHRLISPTNLVMLYLAAVVVAALYLGRGPAVLTSALGVLAFDFFLIEPRFALTVADTEYIFTFIVLFVVGLVISSLAARSSEQAAAARRREVQAVALYELSRDLASASDLDDILRVVVRHVNQTFSRAAVILLPMGDHLRPRGLSEDQALDDGELAAATWTFEQGQPAGRGTNTLATARARYLPLQTARGVIGVLGVQPLDPDSHLAPDQQRLLAAFASQAALAIERAQLAAQAQQARLSQATEELQRALLHSISHDLRTPLVSITGTLTSLEEEGAHLEDAAQRSLITMAREEADRLNHLVGNLLDMTRIEAGALRTSPEPCDIQEVVSAALDRLGSRLEDRPLALETPSLLLPMDFALMVQVLVNLLENALKYSPPHTPIEVTAQVTGGALQISVCDRGDGVPEEDLERIFDKFYRVQRLPRISGTGLGLAICRGIVQSHGGRIWAQNRPGGGLAITLALPYEPAAPSMRSESA